MLLKLFRGTGPATVVLIFMLAIFLWLGSFIRLPATASYAADISPMPFYGLLKSALAFSPIASVTFTFLMVLLMAFLMVNLNTTLFFFNERTFLPAVLYLLITSVFTAKQALTPALPAAVMIMITVRRIMDSYRKPGTAYNFFDAGLLVSAGALFYANTAWFWFLSVAGIALLRTGSPKELLLSFLGFLTPLLIVSSVLYVAGYDMTLFIDNTVYNLLGNNSIHVGGRVEIFTLVLTGLAAAAGVLRVAASSGGMKIKSRKTFSILFWMLFISVFVVLFVPSADTDLVYLAAVPVSYFISWLLLSIKRKLIAGMIFSAIFIMAALIQILNFI